MVVSGLPGHDRRPLGLLAGIHGQVQTTGVMEHLCVQWLTPLGYNFNDHGNDIFEALFSQTQTFLGSSKIRFEG